VEGRGDQHHGAAGGQLGGDLLRLLGGVAHPGGAAQIGRRQAEGDRLLAQHILGAIIGHAGSPAMGWGADRSGETIIPCRRGHRKMRECVFFLYGLLRMG
jgi:hypothetical protein